MPRTKKTVTDAVDGDARAEDATKTDTGADVDTDDSETDPDTCGGTDDGTEPRLSPGGTMSGPLR